MSAQIECGFSAWVSERRERSPHVAAVLRALEEGPSTTDELLIGLQGASKIYRRNAITLLRDCGAVIERDAFPVTGSRRVVERPLRVLELSL